MACVKLFCREIKWVSLSYVDFFVLSIFKILGIFPVMGKNCEGNGEGKIFRKRLLKLTTEIELVENLWFFGSLKAYVWCVRKDN